MTIDLRADNGTARDTAAAWSAKVRPTAKLVLLAVAELRVADRDRIARLTGVDPMTVEELLDDLICGGVLR